MKENRMLLIDGNNLLFRMFFGIPNNIYDAEGKHIHGIVGFIGSILKIINQFEPNYVIVVFDSEVPSEKFDDDNYKKNRVINYKDVPDEENPFTQLSDIKICLDYMGISYIEKEKCEADDVIATICKQVKDVINEIIIVSTDKDFFQLIDNKVKVLCPRGKKSILYDKCRIEEKFGVLPEQYVSYCSLVGDKSDNIRGINGIGKVTASTLIREYHDIPNIYINLKKIKPNISGKLEGKAEIIKNNIYLITMNSNLDINMNLEDYLIDTCKYKEMKTMNIIYLSLISTQADMR